MTSRENQPLSDHGFQKNFLILRKLKNREIWSCNKVVFINKLRPLVFGSLLCEGTLFLSLHRDAKSLIICFFSLDVNAPDKSERTALHIAVLARHKKILEILLAAGADMSIVDRSQDPPLHTAVRIGDENLIQVGF